MVEHVIARSLDEALHCLNQQEYTILSGGTDHMVQKRSWAGTLPLFTKPVLFLHEVKELYGIRVDSNVMEIGAMTSMTAIEEHPQTPPILKECIRQIASPGIRNKATLAGNIANASPAADAVCVLIALHAKVVISSVNHTYETLVEHVIVGPRKTILKQNEMIIAIHIPLLIPTFYAFYKVGGRMADAISKISLAGFIYIHNGKIAEFRLCFGAVGPKVMRNVDQDFAMLGKDIEYLAMEMDAYIDSYVQAISPIDDQRSTKEYRQMVASNLIKKFILSFVEATNG
jgi:xanthine dehydrogenase FAD-binding subunit